MDKLGTAKHMTYKSEIRKAFLNSNKDKGNFQDIDQRWMTYKHALVKASERKLG